jgi:hypothetical protein
MTVSPGLVAPEQLVEVREDIPSGRGPLHVDHGEDAGGLQPTAGAVAFMPQSLSCFVWGLANEVHCALY